MSKVCIYNSIDKLSTQIRNFNYKTPPFYSNNSTENISIPSQSFNKLLIPNKNWFEYNVTINISYVPHISVLHENGTVFPVQENTFEVYSNPVTNNHEYRITGDIDGYSIFQKGTFNKPFKFDIPEGNYYFQVKNGSSWETLRSFSVNSSLPSYGKLNLSFRDEINGSYLSNINVTISNETNILTYNNISNELLLENGTVYGGEYIVKIEKEGYKTKEYSLSSPGEYVLYLREISESDIYHNISFSLIDNTGEFPIRDTKLLITQTSSFGEVLVESKDFSSIGTVETTLINNERYMISVQNGNKTRIIGHMVPTHSRIIQLVLGDIEFDKPKDYFQYKLKKDNETISMEWEDKNSTLIGNFTFSITPTNNTTTQPFVVNSNATFGKISYTIPDKADKYTISLNAMTDTRDINHKEFYIPDSKIVVLEEIPEVVQNVASIFLLIIIALLFSPYSNKIGMFITAIIAAVLVYIGVLHIAILVVWWAVTVIFAARMGNENVRG